MDNLVYFSNLWGVSSTLHISGNTHNTQKNWDCTVPSTVPVHSIVLVTCYIYSYASSGNGLGTGLKQTGNGLEKESFLMPALKSENLVDVSTECFCLHQDQSIQLKRQQGFLISKLVSENSLFRLSRSQLRSNHFKWTGEKYSQLVHNHKTDHECQHDG